MRLNVFIAQATGLSRRASDKAIEEGRISVNSLRPLIGQQVDENDHVTLDGQAIVLQDNTTTIMFNKPAGYVCSRNGQGNMTIYDILPQELHKLKPVGRLDKNSSGLLLLTDDGQLANELTHPSFQKTKVYEVLLDKSLEPLHQQMIADHGVMLDDGPSKFLIEKNGESSKNLKITMREGRNRQIRRTFESLGYHVTNLHRTQFGTHHLGSLKTGAFEQI